LDVRALSHCPSRGSDWVQTVLGETLAGILSSDRPRHRSADFRIFGLTPYRSRPASSAGCEPRQITPLFLKRRNVSLSLRLADPAKNLRAVGGVEGDSVASIYVLSMTYANSESLNRRSPPECPRAGTKQVQRIRSVFCVTDRGSVRGYDDTAHPGRNLEAAYCFKAACQLTTTVMGDNGVPAVG
jgi:hypothetical protein